MPEINLVQLAIESHILSVHLSSIFYLREITFLYKGILNRQIFAIHVYLYASSNRCNNLIYRSPRDCHGEFSFSILPYCSPSEVAPWSESADRELLTGSISSLAPVGVDRQNLRLVCLKQAEDGSGDLIFRFTETQNTATTATLTLPFEPEAAFLATNNEHPTGKLCISGNSVTFFSEPSSYTTVRISRPAK